MTIAILATGDEIVHGDTLNTNSHAIAHALSSEGLSLGLHVACSDKESDILTALHFLCEHHDTVILIGGLGPTSDDRTRFALARFLNLPLVEFPDSIKHIQARLKRGNLSFNAGNRQQALFPEGTLLLPNPNGTAMGGLGRWQGKLFILLPGPPRECLPMFNTFVLPTLEQTVHSQKKLFKWRLFGVAEGEIAEILDRALAHLSCETGYRLETPYLEFKVRCKSSEMDAVKEIIEPLVAPHIIATPETKASERLCQRIEELQRPIVIIDEATGGRLQTLIQRPSNYAWLTFHEKSSDGGLNFYVSGLDEYWQSIESTTTQVKIMYGEQAKEEVESHALAYRSPLVIEFAAEWLCFRLFHLINQLHEGVA